MTGELTAAALVTFRSQSFTAVPVVTIAFPGGNTRRYALRGSPVQSSVGVFRDRLVDIGDIDYRLSDPLGGLQSVTAAFRLEDVDGDLRGLLQAYNPSSLRGAAVTIDLATQDATADWRRLFTGILDSIDPAPGFQWAVQARVDDRPLIDGTFRVPRLSAIDYPYALPGVLERPMPVALGVFDSRDGTVAGSVGSVPLIRLGESDGTGGFPYRYLVCAPYAVGVKRVVSGGTTLSSSAWTRTYTQRSGVATTEVWLASDPGASTTLTAEIMGVGDDVSGSSTYIGRSGTGAPIVNFVSQMRWLLRNYVWSAYRRDAYAGDPASIDTTSWDAAVAWAERKRFRGCFYITEAGQKPIDVLQAFAQWAWLRIGWTHLGTLRIVAGEPEDAPYYTDTRWIRYMLMGSEDALLPSLPRDRTVHAIRSPAWVVPSANAARSIVYVRDTRITGNVETEISHQLGVARQEFQDAYPGPVNILCAIFADRLGSQGDAVYVGHGTTISKWRDINWSPASTAFDFPNSFRTAKTFTPVGAGQEPTLMLDGPQGHAYVRFDGSNDHIQATGVASGITSSEFCVHAVLRVLSADVKGASVFQQDGLVNASDGNWGLYAYTDAGVTYLEAMNNDGAEKSCRYAISLNTWYAVRVRHKSGTLYLSINNWDEVSIGSGSTVGVAGEIRLGYSGGKYAHFDLAALVLFDSGDLAAQGSLSGNSTPGLGSNFDIWLAYADRYGLTV